MGGVLARAKFRDVSGASSAVAFEQSSEREVFSLLTEGEEKFWYKVIIHVSGIIPRRA